jgi:hypothetical protein
LKTVSELHTAVRDLFYWQYSYDPTRFSCMLYDLMGKADEMNLQKLAKAFPEEFMAYQLWLISGNNGHDLFDAYGFHSRMMSEPEK